MFIKKTPACKGAFCAVLLAFLIPLNLYAQPTLFSNSVVTTFVDGPAPAKFERTPGLMRVYADIPGTDLHVRQTLYNEPLKPIPSTAPSTASAINGVNSLGVQSTSTGPKLAAKLDIALGKGAKVAANIAANVPKINLAKAALTVRQVTPYAVGGALASWALQAGIDYANEQWIKKNPNLFPQYRFQSYDVPSSPCPVGQVGTCSWETLLNVYKSAVNPIIESYGYGVDGPGSKTVGFTYLGSCCLTYSVFVIDQNNPDTSTPVTPEQAALAMAGAPLASGGDTAALFDDALRETIKNGFMPQPDTPTISGPPGPISVDSETTTSPDGTVTTKQTAIQPTYNNTNNTVEYQQIDTTTVTNNNNQTTVTTTTKAPDVPDAPTDQKTDCDKYPNSIGCAEFGTPDDSTIPTITPTISITPNSTPARMCPAPLSIPTSRGSFSMTFDAVCTGLDMVRVVLLAFAWLFAIRYVVGASREQN